MSREPYNSENVVAIAVAVSVIAVCALVAVLIVAIMAHGNRASRYGNHTERSRIAACRTISDEELRALCIDKGSKFNLDKGW